MRLIRARIMKEDQRAEPSDCPAGKAQANCLECNYRVGRVRVNWEDGTTVRCRWEECMKREKMISMGVIVDRREDIRLLGDRWCPMRIKKIEVDDD